MADDLSRTEPASPKRRGKARNKGNVPKSMELAKVGVLLGGLLGLMICIRLIGSEMLSVFRRYLTMDATAHLDQNGVFSLLLEGLRSMAVMLLPFMTVVGLSAFLIMRLQVGSLWTTEPFGQNMFRFLDIMQGLRSIMLSRETLLRLVKGMLMAAVVAVAPYMVLKSEMENMMPLFYQDPWGIVMYIMTISKRMAIYALTPMIVIGVADLLYVRWKYEEDLKMTKEEVKDERKESEGDPQIKQKRLQKMFSIMQRRMLKSVPQADVVITNPTHFAVALRYNPLEAPAPVVVAKGVDHLAERIKTLARDNNVPLRENKPLAQALYKSVEVGEAIPEELFQAVATILAEVFRIKGRRR